MKKALIIFLCTFFITQLHSQIRLIDPVQLPESKNFAGRVNCIYQDKLGFIWIGKESGLFRYDGNDLKSYRFDKSNNQSLGSNNVRAIAEDENGDLWIGTKGGGLNLLSRDTDVITRFLHNKKNPESLSFDEVETICPDGKGCFWIGTDGGGLNFFNPKTKRFQRYKVGNRNSKGLLSNQILHIYPHGKGKFWVSTWGAGVFLFDSNNKRFKQLGAGSQNAKLNAFCAKEVKPGFLWIAAFDNGLVQYDIKNNRFSTLLEKSDISYVQGIEISAKGEIYIASYRNLHYFKNANTGTRSLNNTQEEYHNVSSVYIDRNQNIWVGTLSGALGKINSFRRKFNTFPLDAPFGNGFINSIVSDNVSDNVYFVMPENISKHNYVTKKNKIIPLTAGFSTSIIDLPTKNIFLIANADANRLLQLDKRTDKISAISLEQGAEKIKEEGINFIYSPDSKSVWIAGTRAVYEIIQDKESPDWKIKKVLKLGATAEASSRAHYPTSILQQPNGNFWIGTWGGGVSRRLSGATKYTNFTQNIADKHSISNNFVFCMHSDAKGRMWIGTQDGLNYFEQQTGTFKNISINDGLADDWILSITTDAKKRIWVSTRKGISMISSDLKTIRNYDTKDGLPNNEFVPRSFAEDKKGNFYFGNKNGLVSFHPDNIIDNPVLAIPDVVNFKINDKNVEISPTSPLVKTIEQTADIQLENDQNSFSFALAALSFTNSGMNKIKYKLDGYDENWKLAGKNQTAEYFEISSGTYNFSVLAANEDGVWNPKAKKIKIVIARPLWLSNWALLFYLLLISAVVLFYAYKYREFKSEILSTITRVVLRAQNRTELIQPSIVEMNSTDQQFIQKAVLIVEQNIADSDFGVEELCDKMSVSQSNIYRKMNAITGGTVSEFIKEIRLKRAAQLILQNSASISEVAYQVGFNNPKYFSKCFKKQFGVSPKQYTGVKD
jgi:ligand-binding sensor domain-containing protein/AraC-like DNA-binding protein